MAMNYTSLVAPKGTTGSIANWINYSKLDLPVIVDEAQSLLFSLLRVREMRTEWTFGMAVGEAQKALPSRFLDPIGRLYDITNGIQMPHRIETDIVGLRTYDSSLAGDFGADPFTTTDGSSSVAVELTAHDLTQGSTITILLADDVGGLTLNGTFPVTSITDADNLVIDVDEFATSSVTGGGSVATYTANKLISAFPSSWTVFDEQVKFDCAFDTATQFKQLYFRSPRPLSATNLSNWLTNRYPKLMRVSCSAAAADYMKDTEEYNKHLASLTALVGSVNAESDLIYRGAEFGTDTPTPGDYY
jgi:hypothetical protein